MDCGSPVFHSVSLPLCSLSSQNSGSISTLPYPQGHLGTGAVSANFGTWDWRKWGVGFIIGLLPLLLSMSLGIFLVGLVLFLVPLQAAIASIVGTITFVTFAIYFITNLLPVWFPSCPYKTPLSQYIFLLYAYIINLRFFVSLASLVTTPTKPPLRKFRDVERAAVDLRADDLDAHALGWLSGMSSNPSVLNIVVQSTGALPLRSIEPLMQYGGSFS